MDSGKERHARISVTCFRCGQEETFRVEPCDMMKSADELIGHWNEREGFMLCPECHESFKRFVLREKEYIRMRRLGFIGPEAESIVRVSANRLEERTGFVRIGLGMPHIVGEGKPMHPDDIQGPLTDAQYNRRLKAYNDAYGENA